jgi:hypothetical protein
MTNAATTTPAGTVTVAILTFFVRLTTPAAVASRQGAQALLDDYVAHAHGTKAAGLRVATAMEPGPAGAVGTVKCWAADLIDVACDLNAACGHGVEYMTSTITTKTYEDVYEVDDEEGFVQAATRQS